MDKKISLGYHVLFHDNSEDVLIAINPVTENIKKSTFVKEGDSVIWNINDGEQLYEFENIGEPLWEKVKTGNVILVEFTPVGPISEYIIVLE